MDNGFITVRSNSFGTGPENSAPVLPLRFNVVFPYVLTPLTVESEEDIQTVRRAMQHNRELGLFNRIPEEDEFPPPDGYESQVDSFNYRSLQLARTGVLVRVVKQLVFPDGSLRILVRGLRRIRANEVIGSQAGEGKVIYEPLTEIGDESPETAGLMKNAMTQFQSIAGMLPNVPEELRVALANISDRGRLTDMIADSLNLNYQEKLAILTAPALNTRLKILAVLLNRESEALQLGSKIQQQVQEAVGRSQREYFLREQLRVIQQELGEEYANPDLAELSRRLEETPLPDEVVKVVQKELSRLEVIPPVSAEYHVAYNYVDWLLSVPWLSYSDDTLDVGRAAEVLDEDHYGLKDVKERILEFLSVLQLRKDRGKAPILCLVGPPGVGKTSLGQSIARAMDRKFIRVALGGVHDEAEIRGHRRTYVGAMPGRIIQNLKKAGTANPVFMLDELDKLGKDLRGDPASALLDVLDPEQNKAFSDHYLELDFDLSKVFFIATANVQEEIPAPLQDRLEIIRLPGYTQLEKRQIAKRYLVRRQSRECGLKSSRTAFSMPALDEIIDYYTREAGVRQLERLIGQVCRKLARGILDGEFDPSARLSVDDALVRRLLGPHKFLRDEFDETPVIGSANGLAWTSFGGTVLTIETARLPGKGALKLTGSLGNVMKESAEAAYTVVRGRAESELELPGDYFEKKDLNIHVPDGATPKDGPSAGITLVTALWSLITGQSMRPALAMTGEITLRGRVTAIGGVKEKVIAAMRAGVDTVLLPHENGKDLEELPKEVKSALNFLLVRNIDEALPLIFPVPGEPGKIPAAERRRNSGRAGNHA